MAVAIIATIFLDRFIVDALKVQQWPATFITHATFNLIPSFDENIIYKPLFTQLSFAKEVATKDNLWPILKPSYLPT